MRFKDLLNLFPAPRRALKHAYSTITLTRYTTIYFTALLLSTITLASLQLSSHITNHHADITLSTIMRLASVQSNLIPIVSNQDGQDVLQLCNGIPSGSQDGQCQTVYAPTPIATQTQLPANAGVEPSSTLESTATQSTVTPVPEAQTPASTSTSVISTSSIESPGLLFAAQPTSTSISTATSTTGFFVADIPESTTTTTTVASTTSSKDAKIAEATSTSDIVSTTTTVDQSTRETLASSTTDAKDTTADQTTTSVLVLETNSLTSSSSVAETSSVATSTTTTSDTVTSAASTSDTETSTTTEEKEIITTTSVDQDSSSTTSTTVSTSDRTSTTQTPTPTPTPTPAEKAKVTSSSAGDVSASESKTVEVSSSIVPTPRTVVPSSTESSSKSRTESKVTSSDGDVSNSEPKTVEASSSVVVLTLQTVVPSSTESDSKSRTESTSTSVSSTATPTSSSTTSLVSDQTTTTSSSETSVNQTRRHEDRMLLRRGLNAVPVTNSTTGAILGLNVTDIAGNGSGDVTFVDLRCAQTLVLAEEQLHESWTEDLVMVGYHIWLFGLGAMAILHESIPHLIAAFISSVLALIWSGSQIAETRGFYNQFNTFIINGACNGVDILPDYWTQRSKIDTAIFVINVLAVLALGGLGSKLVSVYRRQMTKVVGEEKGVMRRLYKTVLLLSIVIQIGAFLLLASLALWVQQLFTSPIASFSTTTPAFKGVGLLSVFMTIPWFIIGWVAIRREHKILMVVFLVMDFFFLASWITFFSSDVYRLVFTKWTFFAVLTVATFFLLVGSLIAGILCRMHFGMGLAAQLEEKAKDEVDVTPWDFSSTTEKAWEPFERSSIRQSQFTAISSDRQSTAFSYGLRSPAPPLPPRPTLLSRFSNVTQ